MDKIRIKKAFSTVEQYNTAKSGKPIKERILSLKEVLKGKSKEKDEFFYRMISVVNDVVIEGDLVHLQTKPFKACDGKVEIRRYATFSKTDLIEVVASIKRSIS